MFLKIFRRNTSSERADLELIELYKESEDNRYVGELFERYTHLVFGVCLKYIQDTDESKDVVMLIFEKLLIDLKRFEVQNFSAWLHRLSRNYCLMYLRQKKSEYKRADNFQKEQQDDMEFDANWHHEDAGQIHEQQLYKLETALDSLNPEQNQCISLFYLEEKSYQQIAKQTGMSLKQVKSHIQNGKRNIKKHLGLLVILFGLLITLLS